MCQFHFLTVGYYCHLLNRRSWRGRWLVTRRTWRDWASWMGLSSTPTMPGTTSPPLCLPLQWVAAFAMDVAAVVVVVVVPPQNNSTLVSIFYSFRALWCVLCGNSSVLPLLLGWWSYSSDNSSRNSISINSSKSSSNSTNTGIKITFSQCFSLFLSFNSHS